MNTLSDEQLKELEAIRLAFEDWTGHSKPPERIDDDTYRSKPLQSYWRLWQGAVEYANERNKATIQSLRTELAAAKES